MRTFISQHSDTATAAKLAEVFDGVDASGDLAVMYEAVVQKSTGVSSVDDLVATTEKLNVPPTQMRYPFPSVFDVGSDNSEFTWLYQSEDYQWRSLAALVASEGVKAAMLFTPLAWQLGTVFYNQCREAGVVVSAFDPAALQSAELMLAAYPIDLLVTTSDGLRDLLLNGVALPGRILIVVPWGSKPLLAAPDNTQVHYDVQLSPGFSVGQQAHAGGVLQQFSFAPTEDYLFEVNNDTLFVTSLSESPVPLKQYELPGAVTVTDNLVSFHHA